MTRRLPALALAAAVFTACGCSPAPAVRTYDVFVTNKLPEPVTVFLTKDGPPAESGWLSPEMMAAGPVNQDPLDSGRVIGPGYTGGAAGVSGKFDPQTAAVLRVYRQTGKLEDFAAISPGNPKRLDVPLRPGANAFVVTQGPTGMAVDPVRPPNPQPSPQSPPRQP